MKKLRFVLAIGLLSFGLTACNVQPQPEPEPEPEIVNVESVTLNKQTLNLYLTKSEYLVATIAPSNATVQYLTWTSANEDIALVNSAGKVSALGIGTTTVRATSVADSSKYAECTVNVTREDTTIHVTGITLDKTTEQHLYVGKNLTFTANIAPANATDSEVIWTSSNDGVAVVNNQGKVTGISAGIATITATSHEKSDIKASCDVRVEVEDTKTHVKTIAVSPKIVAFDLGGTTEANPTVTFDPADATDKGLVWTSSDPSKVAVDSSTGHLIGLAVTTEPVLITVKSVDNSNATDTLAVTVADTRDPEVHVTGVTLQESITLDLKNGGKGNLTATIAPNDAWNKLVNWSLSSSDVVSYTALGDHVVSLQGLKVGSATITATSDDNPSATATCTINVIDSTKYVTGVDIKNTATTPQSIDNIDITLGDNASITANVLPLDADNQGIVWTLPDASKAYVSLGAASGNSQTIISKAATTQPVDVIATSAENPTISKTLKVTVIDPTIYVTGVTIKINGEPTETVVVEKLANVNLTASVSPIDATYKGITWSYAPDQTNPSDYVTIGSLDQATTTITGKKKTTTPIVIRASSTSQPDKYKDISVSVIDPISLNRFVSFGDPSSYLRYLSQTKDMNTVANLPSQASLATGKFYAYDSDNASKAKYKVGDQGEFVFAPSGQVILAGEATKQTTVANIKTNKELFVWNDDKYEKVDNMSNYVTVTDNSVYQFNEDAVGKSFKLVLSPDTATYYVDNPETAKYTFEFDVIKGYNIDEDAELSLFDNSQSAWNDYKAEHNLTDIEVEGGLVLHKDINFTQDMIPADFKWDKDFVENYISTHQDDFNNFAHKWYADGKEAAKEALIDSPKDYRNILSRNTSESYRGEDEEFRFEGNFFSINATSCKRIGFLQKNSVDFESLMKGTEGDGSHTTLFGFNDNFTGSEFPTDAFQVIFRNLSVLGNGSLGDGSPAKGGLIGFKFETVAATVENAIVSRMFTAFMLQDNNRHRFDDNTYVVPAITSGRFDRITSFDCYSSIFYVFGTQDNEVSNAWLSKCGGAIFLLDEPVFDTGAGQSISDEKAATLAACFDCANCYAHNEITGTEPWFADHNAGSLITGQFIAPGIEGSSGDGWYLAAAKAVSGGRTIGKKYNDDYKVCDLVCLHAAMGNPTGNVSKNLSGHFNIVNGTDNSVIEDMSLVAKDAESLTPLFPYSNQQFYMFQSRATTLANFDGSALTDFHGVNPTAHADGYFTNEYTTAYLNPAALGGYITQGRYIGIVLGTYAIA